jgi:hypothetical protein
MNWRHAPLYPIYLLSWAFLTFLPRLASNCDMPNLYLLSIWDYRHEPQCLAVREVFNGVISRMSDFCVFMSKWE